MESKQCNVEQKCMKSMMNQCWPQRTSNWKQLYSASWVASRESTIAYCDAAFDHLQIVFEKLVHELEVSLSPIHPKVTVSRGLDISTLSSFIPCALVVEEPICTLLVLLRDLFRLLMPLEPGLILLVEPPALIFQRPCR
jgi:hypothetical protein